MIDKVRIFAALAVLVAAALLFQWQRSHYIGLGESRVQARWNAQRLADEKEALREERERRAEENRKVKEAERITDENHVLQQEMADLRVAVVHRERSLHDDIADLQQRLTEQERTSQDALAAARAREACTVAELLGRCTARYRTVAAAAQELKIQVMGLQDWEHNVCQANGQGHEE